MKSSSSLWPLWIFSLSEVPLGNHRKHTESLFHMRAFPNSQGSCPVPHACLFSSRVNILSSFSHFSCDMPLSALTILVTVRRMQSKLTKSCPAASKGARTQHSIPNTYFQGVFQPGAVSVSLFFSTFSGPRKRKEKKKKKRPWIWLDQEYFIFGQSGN